MAFASDVDSWKAFGGSVGEKTSGQRVIKTWIASDGRKFRTWKEAAAFMESTLTEEEQGRKRQQATPSVTTADNQQDRKRQKASEQPSSAKKQRKTPAKKTEKDENAAPTDDEVQPMEVESAAVSAEKVLGVPSKSIGSGRRAAQGKQYQEKDQFRTSKSDRVMQESEKKVGTEAKALQETAKATAGSKRRLLQFSTVDDKGDLQPLDRMELLQGALRLTGAIYPGEGPMNKAEGRLLAKPFGPITSWHVQYISSGPTAVACTAEGSYLLSKPATSYKKMCAALEEQMNLTWHVLQALDASFGGSPSASLDAVVAKLARAKAAKGYSSAREALLLNGRFVLAQIAAHETRKAGPAAAAAGDKSKGKAAAELTSGPFCSELQAELAKGSVQVGIVSANAITIREVSAHAAAGSSAPAAAADAGSSGSQAGDENALMAADEDMARRLQAKMDAETMAGTKGRGRGAAGAGRSGTGNAYIKISEAEIADDYPPPKQYAVPAGVEETDELLLWDEELADCDPELLPKRLLTEFSIYNAEGFFASLELLPMWSGVDPDVELFASGIVKDDEGHWGTGGQPLQFGAPKIHQLVLKQGNSKADAAVLAVEAAGASGSSSEAAVGSSSATGASRSGADGSSNSAGGSSDRAGGGGSGATGSSAAGGSGSSSAGGSSAAAADDIAAAADDVAVVAGPDPVAEGGMRLFLSQIREWVVEFSADMLFISVRTDAAWYKLCRPDPKYTPWFGVPLKSARVAVAVINALAGQMRTSRLSFADVVKMLAETPPGSHTFISKKLNQVERYLVVHGQILLNQIKAYPNVAVQRSPFVATLKDKMEMRRHSKLYYSKRGFSKAPKGVNRNPMKDRASSGRPKPMPATATTMVRSIWQNYFYAMDEWQQDGQEGEAEAAGTSREPQVVAAAAAAPVAQEVEDDPLEEEQADADAQEDALAGPSSPAAAAAIKKSGSMRRSRCSTEQKGPVAALAVAASKGKSKSSKPQTPKVSWVDSVSRPDSEGRLLHRTAQVGDWKVQLGSVVLLEAESEVGMEQTGGQQQQHVFGLLQCMWQDKDGQKMAQVRLLVPGADTVLGDAASDAELFITDSYDDVPLSEVQGLAAAKQLQRDFDPDLRVQQFEDDEKLRKHNAAAKAAGKPLEYFFRHLYLPEQGMFRALQQQLELGSYYEPPADPVELDWLSNGAGFIKNGVEYRVGDFMFVEPDTFDSEEAASSSESEKGGCDTADSDDDKESSDNKAKLPAYASKKGRFHKGSCAGLRAWGLARLLEVKEPFSNGNALSRAAKAGKLKLQRFFRPEDISADEAYTAGYWDLYASPGPSESSSSDSSCDWLQWVKPDCVIRKCAAAAGSAHTKSGTEGLDCFQVVGTYKPTTKKISAPPAEFATAASSHQAATAQRPHNSLALATMDIFAGCGGLSEGMHQAGVADSKWAIEYEQPAADAFKLNNPDAAVFCNNCNVILLAAMHKAGLDKDCSACDDARTAVTAMSEEDRARLPRPGEVEFIMGGPPCQGYSGMNRFNKGNWSMVQNSMVMSFLSFADFYRPRYFLLENVRNFVSHNKSFTFRMTLRTLLDMGYQVRFGVLNAGNYGVPQSRKRTFIWAAAPDEGLPAWPQPKHVFRSPQLTVNLPGGVAYCAVDTSIPGAPLRTVTVKDAIGDLPPIENGHDQDPMDYTGPAVSAFQKAMRGKAKQLQDHICKEMNLLNLERCRCIPKDTPGADWRVLLEIVNNDPSKELYNGQPLVPWCLPNTADRHNGWRGLFGRLDMAGHFPTSTTDPQPMGKVGQVFHPNQNRIVSVRECARSQGFPDHFHFSGNVHARHRQVGNAVPPPLAASLGRQLRAALEDTHKRRLAAFNGGL